jgi:quercetin dioxygenase-like cupin family protein
MNDRFTTRLVPGQALTLRATRAPRRLVVTSGRLWLTVSGGNDDHWLHAGEALTLAPGQEVVVEAWPKAEFQLLQPAPQRRVEAKPTRGWRVNLAPA